MVGCRLIFARWLPVIQVHPPEFLLKNPAHLRRIFIRQDAYTVCQTVARGGYGLHRQSDLKVFGNAFQRLEGHKHPTFVNRVDCDHLAIIVLRKARFKP